MDQDIHTSDHSGGSTGAGDWQLPGYTHGRELGAGAAGRVVLAHHAETGTPVAVKYLNNAADHTGLRTEAELLAGLDSPHVTRLYEYVEGPQGAAIVMELVEGIALRDLLRAEGATTPEAALTVLKGSLLGLAAAHRAGVVHRDYKPGNVLVTVDGDSKLVDFGIALPSGGTGTVAGTPAYMAPEQWTGRPASPTTDVYAATATFFECLTGAKPYAGTTLVELAVQHTEAEIPDEQAPEALRPLIRAGLAKDPEERPEGAEQLVELLESVAGQAYGEDWEERGRRKLAALVALLPLLLPSAGGQAAGSTSFATTVLGPLGGASRVGSRTKVIGAAAGFVLIAGALAGVAVAGTGDSAATTRAAAPAVTTSVTASDATPSAATAPSPSAAATSASPSASASPSPSVTATTTTPSAPGKPAAPPTAPGTPTAAPPTVPVVVPPPPPPVLHVHSVTVGGTTAYMCWGLGATYTVITDGAADGTLTLTWFSTDYNGTTTVVATDPPITLTKGVTRFSASVTHPMPNNVTTWGLRAATTPAPDGRSVLVAQTSAPACIK